MDGLSSFYKDKDIIVTGGCGSIGSEIVRSLLKYDVKKVRVFDNNEAGLFNIQNELREYGQVRTLLGDIRDPKRLKWAMRGVDFVFHAAALKHVPLCEYNPFEAIATNVVGTQNVIEAAANENVGRFVTISTDKAVNPINTMGATKLLSEKLVLNAPIGEEKILFSCVRLGNVFNSVGSVIPVFTNQIKKGGPLTITSKKMIRFFMSMPKAVELVLNVAKIMEDREIYILKMKALRIIDLAEMLIEELAPSYGFKPNEIKIKSIGVRPGEKLYEKLMTDEEAYYARVLGEMFVLKHLTVTPHYVEEEPTGIKHIKKEMYDARKIKVLSKNEIRKFIQEHELAEYLP
jgi:FlaA1/EpsC-like NDP-sugar epimerase